MRDYIAHKIQVAQSLSDQQWKGLFEESFSSSAIYHFLSVTKEPGTRDSKATAFRTQWQEHNISKGCLQTLPRDIQNYYQQHFGTPKIDISTLPSYSFVLQFTFTLAQPYISRDEQDFFIIPNPIRKDKIFGLPYVASTTWKGSLRAALRKSGYGLQSETVSRLFGNEKEEENQENFRAGRLYFFPTFFMSKSLEVINPHDRETRTGKLPIVFESVPTKEAGTFTLLYVPFDRIGKDEQETRKQVAEELQLVATGLQKMFRIHGFGAKTSSGFGLAAESISGGSLKLRTLNVELQKEEAVSPIPSSPPSLARYLETPTQLKQEYLSDEGTFRERPDTELKQMSKSSKQLYQKAKEWWEREKKRQIEETQQNKSAEPAPIEAPIHWPTWSFNSFEKLLQQAREVANKLFDGGDVG